MKILLLSDSHGSDSVFYDAYDAEKPDMILFAGDGVRGMLEFRDCYLCPAVDTYIVCGNCDRDFRGDFYYSQTVALPGHRVYLTHGHVERVKEGLSLLASGAKLNQCDIAVYGHTHRPADFVKDGVRLINPGAAAAGFYGVLTVTAGSNGIDVEIKRI